MLTFHMTPGSCSTGIHILLEMLELPFQVTVVNLPAGDHRKPAYLAVNPKGTIPTLVLDDGRALTDWLSIAWWLAAKHPRRKLLPEDVGAQAEVLATVNHCVGTVHGAGYTRVFTPEAYLAPDLNDAARQTEIDRLATDGRRRVSEGLALLEAQLAAHAESGGWLCGAFSIADAALFYLTFWAERIGLPMPERCADHLRRMKALPVVRQVLAEEGYR